MAVVIDGTTGISTPAETVLGNLSYTGTLTGGTGVVNLGSGQVYKDASGNVGVGTATPVGKLQIAQTNSTAINGGSYINLGKAENGVGGYRLIGMGYNAGSNYAPTYMGYVETSNNAGTAGDLVWFTRPSGSADTVAPTERARIDSSGNLLVGTTTNPHTGLLVLRKSGNDWKLVISDTFAGTQSFATFRYDTTGIGSILGNNTSVSYNTSSDYRLKDNIAPMTGALAKVALLKPVTYKWKVDGSDGQGFIAHELAEVEAGCVTGEKDAVDADGNPQYQGIDTSFLIATLSAAIQELHALVKTQAERITALEGTAA